VLAHDDPATLIETTFHTVDLPPRHERVAELEYVVPDYNKFAMLARARQHSGVLSAATGGQLHRSARYREILDSPTQSVGGLILD
jgi:hypothetical protein